MARLESLRPRPRATIERDVTPVQREATRKAIGTEAKMSAHEAAARNIRGERGMRVIDGGGAQRGATGPIPPKQAAPWVAPKLVDKGVVFDPKGSQPAEVLWGVGAKTAERIRAELKLDPSHVLTVADFAYAPPEMLAKGPSRELLAHQQSELVNEKRVPLEAADPSLTVALRARREQLAAEAVTALDAPGRPTHWIAEHLVSYANRAARRYGVFGVVTGRATAEEIAAAEKLGMKIGPGEIVLAARHRLAPGDTELPATGVVLISVDPKTLIEPAIVAGLDNRASHMLGRARGVKAERGYVIEYPDRKILELDALTAEGQDLVGAVWRVPKTERAGVLAAFRAKLERMEQVTAQVREHEAARAQTIVTTMRALYDITAKYLDY
jgi:hypothetical protein